MRNKAKCKGFTLVEIMVSVAILSLGIFVIHEAFMTSLNSYNYCYNYLSVASLADEKIWEAKEVIRSFGTLSGLTKSGKLVLNNKVFDWGLTSGLMDSKRQLYRLKILLTWKEGRRNIHLSRTAYARYETEE